MLEMQLNSRRGTSDENRFQLPTASGTGNQARHNAGKRLGQPVCGYGHTWRRSGPVFWRLRRSKPWRRKSLSFRKYGRSASRLCASWLEAVSTPRARRALPTPCWPRQWKGRQRRGIAQRPERRIDDGERRSFNGYDSEYPDSSTVNSTCRNSLAATRYGRQEAPAFPDRKPRG